LTHVHGTLLVLQELQTFYATYISPASTQRRKLCIHITPTGGQQQQQQKGGDSSSAPIETKHPQEHVQHEFGVLHPAGEHTQHSTQHTRQEVEAHAVNGGDLPTATGSAAAAAADGSQESPSTRQNKRPRRQQEQQTEQQQQQQGGGGAPSLSAVQAAPVQVIADLKGFKATAGRYEAYSTVQPQLKC
jgi:hypothetical protein